MRVLPACGPRFAKKRRRWHQAAVGSENGAVRRWLAARRRAGWEGSGEKSCNRKRAHGPKNNRSALAWKVRVLGGTTRHILHLCRRSRRSEGRAKGRLRTNPGGSDRDLDGPDRDPSGPGGNVDRSDARASHGEVLRSEPGLVRSDCGLVIYVDPQHAHAFERRESARHEPALARTRDEANTP